MSRQRHSTAPALSAAERSAEEQGLPSLAACFALMSLLWLLLIATSVLLAHRDWSWLIHGPALALAAWLLTVAWERRQRLISLMTSLPFAVAELVVLAACTALGTVIAQQAAPAWYHEQFGELWGSALVWLGLQDLFHSTWFSGLLAIAAVSLLLTAVKKRAWRPVMWGHLLSHLGFVVVLLGGWIGSQYGFKGMIDLREGRLATHYTPLGTGSAVGPAQPLGFALKLEQFTLEHYEATAKCVVYERKDQSMRAVQVYDVDSLHRDLALGSQGAQFRIEAVYPDYAQVPEVHPVMPGTGRPALQVTLQQDNWQAQVALSSGPGATDRAPLSAAGPFVRFAWTAPDAETLAQWTTDLPALHELTLQAEAGGPVERFALPLGASQLFAQNGYEISTLAFYPDFDYDTRSKKPRTRSQEPRNPALQVRVKNLATQRMQERWLYANMPNFNHAQDGLRLVYRYQEPRSAPERELVVIGATEEIWGVRQGQITQRLPLAQWPSLCEGLAVTGMQVFPSAEINLVPGSLSAAWNNPAVRLRLQEDGKSREVLLTAGHERPLRLSDGNTFLALEMRNRDPKAFRSRLVVLEDGKPVLSKTIAVNDPLSYKGMMFYQANFRQDDMSYSGIKVVSDPGLMLAIIGMIMMGLGMPYVYYVRPRLLRNAQHES